MDQSLMSKMKMVGWRLRVHVYVHLAVRESVPVSDGNPVKKWSKVDSKTGQNDGLAIVNKEL